MLPDQLDFCKTLIDGFQEASDQPRERIILLLLDSEYAHMFVDASALDIAYLLGLSSKSDVIHLLENIKKKLKIYQFRYDRNFSTDAIDIINQIECSPND